MGSLTRAQIITQGLEEVGRTDLATLAIKALRAWLRSREKDWPFPYLRQSRTDLALPAGTTSLRVGAGEGGITNEIQRILYPFWIRTSDYGTQAKAGIQTLDNREIGNETRINNPATAKGLPQAFKVRNGVSTVGSIGVQCKTLIPTPVPDRDLLISFDYIELETDPIPLDGTIPRYPNDMTMVKFIEMWGWKKANGPSDENYMACREELAAMLPNDRIHDSQEPGTNDMVQLAPDVFR